MINRLIPQSDSSKFIPQELYNQILVNMPVACVDIALVSHGSVLLVKRKDAPAKGEWWVPGGRVIKGETMIATAKRKAIDEVGIRVHVGPIVHTDETIFDDGPCGIAVHSINSCFFVYPEDPDFSPTLDSHHEDWRWVNTIDLSLHTYVKQCLAGAGLRDSY